MRRSDEIIAGSEFPFWTERIFPGVPDQKPKDLSNSKRVIESARAAFYDVPDIEKMSLN